MANRVQDRSRNKGNISGGESSEEKEKKPVRGSSVKWAEEASDSWVESDVESKAEGGTSEETGTVRIRRVSTRTLD
jgi:hypothetical protein